MYGFFANLFPWFNPTGTDGAAEGQQQPSEEEIERRIQEAGIDEETIVGRTQRMMELQRNLLGGEPGGAGEPMPGGFEDELLDAEVGRDHQPRVEDAADDNER